MGLYSRFFLLFGVTTLLLAILIALGSFTYSEEYAKRMILERHDRIYAMMTTYHDKEIDLDELREAVKDPRAELMIVRGEEVWKTWENFPDKEVLMASAEPLQSLYISKHGSRYYLIANEGEMWVAATALIVNLVVYPSWLVYWPWLLALLVLTMSYMTLRRWLRPVTDALKSAQEISQGNFSYRIENHPKTELADLTHGLNHMATDLQQMFDAKKELLLAISHELRTPMARMKISLAMLESNSAAADLGKDIAQMDQLIEQLLEGERLEQGHKVLHLSSYYLPSFIEELIAEQDNFELFSIIGSIPEEAIQLDIGRIKFLLRNLLRNGIEHSKGEKVSLEVKKNADEFVFNVMDKGTGIPHASLDQIFEPFNSVENIDNRSTNGVGLGLYLCRKIAHAHGGQLSVTSAVGTGSCFSLRLPALQSEAR